MPDGVSKGAVLSRSDAPARKKAGAHNLHATGSEKLLAHLAMLCFAAIIAGSFSIGGLVAPYLDPRALNGARFILGVAVMSGVVFATYGRIPRPPGGLRGSWRYALMGGLMATYFVLMFAALQIAKPVSTGAMFTLIPLMSAGFGWLFLRQTTRAIVLVSLLVAAAGSLWVIFHGDLDALLGFRIGKGEAIFFFGCIAHAAYAPLVRKMNRGEPVLVFAFFNLVGIMVWIVMSGIREIFATDWATLPGMVYLGIVYLSLMATVLTFILLNFASMRLPASKVLSYGYLTPVFIILYEGMIGHGWETLSVMAGALVTAAALLIMALAPDA